MIRFQRWAVTVSANVPMRQAVYACVKFFRSLPLLPDLVISRRYSAVNRSRNTSHTDSRPMRGQREPRMTFLVAPRIHRFRAAPVCTGAVPRMTSENLETRQGTPRGKPSEYGRTNRQRGR